MAPKILMVDDDVELCTITRAVFEARGFEFAVAHSAREGLETIREVEPDLVLLDVMMEDMVAGFRFATTLRDPADDSPYRRFRDVPILMLTSVQERTKLRFSQEAGAPDLPVDAFEEKPIKPGELLDKVRRMLALTAD